MKKSIFVGFWFRLLAFIIDLIIISIFTNILALPFKNLILKTDGDLWYVGLIIFLIYFVLFTTKLGKGYSFGDMILKIRVLYVN